MRSRLWTSTATPCGSWVQENVPQCAPFPPFKKRTFTYAALYCTPAPRSPYIALWQRAKCKYYSDFATYNILVLNATKLQRHPSFPMCMSYPPKVLRIKTAITSVMHAPIPMGTATVYCVSQMWQPPSKECKLPYWSMDTHIASVHYCYQSCACSRCTLTQVLPKCG